MGILPGADKCQQKDVKHQQLLPGLFIPLIPTEAHKEFTRNPQGMLLIKTNKRALAVHNQLPSRSILALCLSSSSFRIGGSAGGSYSCPSAGASVIFPSRLHQRSPAPAAPRLCNLQSQRHSGMVFSTFIHYRESCHKSFADKAQQYMDKRKAWHWLEMVFVGNGKEKQRSGCSLFGHRGICSSAASRKDRHTFLVHPGKSRDKAFFPGVSDY